MFKNMVWLSFLVAGSAMAAGTAKIDTAPVKGHKPSVAPVISHGIIQGGTVSVKDLHFTDADGDIQQIQQSGNSEIVGYTTYQWQINRVDVSGETRASMVLPANVKIGDKVRVGVIARTNPDTTDPSEGDVTYSNEEEILPGSFKMIVNGVTFDVGKGTRFPSSHPRNGTLKVVVDGGNNADYRFELKTDKRALGISSTGEISSDSLDHLGETYTLTAYPKGNYQGDEGMISYNFRIDNLFSYVDTNQLFTFDGANKFCIANGFTGTAPLYLLTSQYKPPFIRTMSGRLFDEWGPLSAFGWPVGAVPDDPASTVHSWYWTKSVGQAGTGRSISVDVGTGFYINAVPSHTGHAICVRS